MHTVVNTDGTSPFLHMYVAVELKVVPVKVRFAFSVAFGRPQLTEMYRMKNSRISVSLE